MDDLTRCLYEFLMETRMGRIWEDEEYKACNSGLLLQEQRVRSRLSGDQEAELDRFLDCMLERDSVEKEHLFQSTLDLLRELSALAG